MFGSSTRKTISLFWNALKNNRYTMSNIENKALSIAIMSGKGGVGKSNIALNIGYALAKDHCSTLLLDCDLGLANLDVLLGIAPEYNINDVLKGKISANEALVPLMQESLNSENKFSLLPATSGISELADMTLEESENLLKTIEPAFKDYSMLLLDLGAGISDSVQYFAAMAAIRLIILTPEPTSLTDAYALIKVLKTNLQVNEFLVVVNQADSQKEAKDVYDRLAVACERFLEVKPVYLGFVHSDPKISDSVRRQKPLLSLHPDSKAAKDITDLASRLTKIYATMLPKISKQAPLKHQKN